ncbi:kita-kyushu lung cancer antigen 1 [Rousettus aegyptiacus]|uniref:Cancer/testis antigen 83 n=1 Tax=Rousettus aegyptiacus TaxID=9407 RepID=A0A7J8EIM0_ROUAE|nr:kita-kyushu lung cancer antigen 1 [Rousettus aegyptiacus]KAF6435253.1 cancer/testis antigen 83 [Rousettus aegyptiacus]
MSILLLLVGGVLFACIVVYWKNQFQRNSDEISSNSTSLALVRPSSSTGSSKSNTDKDLTANSTSQDILINFPHSIAMQKRIWANLGMVEYKLAELEHLLVTKNLNGALVNRKSTGMFTKRINNESNQ